MWAAAQPGDFLSVTYVDDVCGSSPALIRPTLRHAKDA